MPTFVTKDSGERQQYASGMRRDVQTDKPDMYQWMPKSIPYKESLWYRIGMLAERGAVKYGRRNWELAGSNPASAAEELERFQSSALRHLMQWLHNETDEDHAAAVFFNLVCAEMVKTKMQMRELEYDCAHCGLCDEKFNDCKCTGEYGSFVERDTEDIMTIQERFVSDREVRNLLEYELDSMTEDEAGPFEQAIALTDHPFEAMIPDEDV